MKAYVHILCLVVPKLFKLINICHEGLQLLA